jgi:hypothetical protein
LGSPDGWVAPLRAFFRAAIGHMGCYGELHKSKSISNI